MKYIKYIFKVIQYSLSKYDGKYLGLSTGLALAKLIILNKERN